MTFVLLALRRRWKCNLEIGIQNYPFADAWVECDGKVVMDSQDLRTGLAIILNEPFRRLKTYLRRSSSFESKKVACEIHENRLVTTLSLYTSAPALIKKPFLTLCYSERSEEHDMDEVGGNETTLFMGRIFDKSSSSALKPKDFEFLSSRNKEEALGKIWGKYVYIKGNPEGSEFEVVIDPTGQLPFFYYFLPNGDVLFSSDIEIIFKVLSQTRLKSGLPMPTLSTGNSSLIVTPFKHVFEVPPGCCLKLTKNEHKTELFWNPLSTFNSSPPFQGIVLTF